MPATDSTAAQGKADDDGDDPPTETLAVVLPMSAMVVLSRWVRAKRQTFRLGAGKQTLPKAVQGGLRTYAHWFNE